MRCSDAFERLEDGSTIQPVLSNGLTYRYIDLAADAVLVVDKDANFIDLNPALCSQLGYSRAELLSMKVDDVLPADDETWQEMRAAMETGVYDGVSAEITCRRKDESRVTFDITARALENGSYLAFARDATERKRAEEAVRSSEAQLKHILETSPIGVAGTNLAGTEILFTNSRFNDLLGRPGDELVGQDPRDFFAHADDGAEIVRQSQTGKRVVDQEVEIRSFDGEVIWALMTAEILNFGGQKALVAWIYDITELKRAEQATSVAKDDAADARALLADAVENISDGFVLFDADDRLAAYNSKYQEFYRYTDDDLASVVTWRDLYEIDDRRQTIAWEGRLSRTGDKKNWHDFERKLTDGRWLDLHWRPTSLGGMVGIQVDITEPREAREALADSERKFRSYVEAATEGVCVLSADGRFVDVNPAGCRMLGYTLDELCQMTLADTLLPEHRPAAHEALRELQEGRISRETLAMRKDGSIMRVEGNAAPLGDGTYLVVTRDVTAQRAAQKQVEDSEKKFRSYVDQAIEGVLVVDGEYRFVDVNPALCALLGYTREEMLQMNVLELLPPSEKSRQATREAIRQADEGDYKAEITWRCKDGSLIPFDVSVRSLGDDRYLAFAHDATERQRAERALQQAKEDAETLATAKSEFAEMQRELLEAFPGPLAVSDPETDQVLYANEYSRSVQHVETGKGTIAEVYRNPDDRRRLVGQLREHGRVDDFEAEVRRPEGGYDWSLMSARMIEFEGRQAVLVASQNITERKHAEALLRQAKEDAEALAAAQSEFAELQRDMLNGIPVPLILTDLETRKVLYLNEHATGVHGLAIGKAPPEDFWHDFEDRRRLLDQLRRDGRVDGFETRFLTRSGYEWFLMSARATDYEGRRAMLATTHNIDERKRTEALLEQAKDEAENLARERSELADMRSELIEAIPNPVILSGIESGRVLLTNEAARKNFGTDVGMLQIESRYRDPNDRPRLLNLLREHGRVDDFETEFLRPDGGYDWILLSGRIVTYEGEEAILGTGMIINERKEAEAILRKAKDDAEELAQAKSDFAERQRELVESIPVPMVIANIDSGTVLFANELGRSAHAAVPGVNLADT